MNIKNQPRLPRTTESKIFEAAAVVLLIIMWAIILHICTTITGDIPTHFDANGVADGYGGAGDAILIGVVGTFCTLLFIIGSYYPKWVVNVPVRIDTPRKVALMSRMCRVLGIEMTLMFIFIILTIGEYVANNSIINVIITVAFATALGFCIAATRSK